MYCRKNISYLSFNISSNLHKRRILGDKVFFIFSDIRLPISEYHLHRHESSGARSSYQLVMEFWGWLFFRLAKPNAAAATVEAAETAGAGIMIEPD